MNPGVVVIFVILVALASSLRKDFLRPALARRNQRARAERLEELAYWAIVRGSA